MASYSNEQIEQVKELASVFFSPREIATILELPVDEFQQDCLNENNAVGKAYLAGKLKKEWELRKSIIQLATSGSSPAQAMSMELVKQNNLKMLDR